MGIWGWAVDELHVILIVEDDQLVQGFVEEALSEAGFEPAVATSGEEALTLLKGHNGKYRALVTDINLRSRIDGREIAQQAREMDPARNVVHRPALAKVV
jgi:DNA-binding response OmpR family regulator